jgi:4-alpha-glucanotransferase
MKCIHNNERISGLVVPLLSLRKNKSAACGVFSDLTELAKLAKQWGLSLIQLLPLNDTGNGTSPYSALSAFALHPIYISLPEVPKTMESLGAPLAQSAIDILKKAENKLARAHAGNKRVAFEAVLSDKLAALRSVWNESQEYCRPLAELFAAQETWAKPYACFMALKEKYGLAPWWEWPEYRDVTPADIETLWDSSETGEEARFRLWLQILAREQLKDAAHSVAGMSIDIMGDIPILLAKDSADVWYNRDIFIINSQAGAPPDMYSPRGQNWGFPLYNWDALKAGDYAFWRQRLAYADQFYTSYRIDHVLGFFRIWAISAFESEAFLGEFEPSERLARSELSALGFSDERITWLSKPHIPEWKIQNIEERCIDASCRAEGAPQVSQAAGAKASADRRISLEQRLSHLRQACFARINNEPLFLFSPEIRGTADINTKVAVLKGDFPQAASALSDYAQSMCEWWTDRALYEVEPDRFVSTWEYHNTTSWKSLSVQEQEALEQKAAELASKSLAVWEAQGRELLSMLVASTDMQPFAEDLGAALKDPRKRVLVSAAGLLVTVNWGIYIYAVNSGHVLETALGYYINPLLSVALGAMLFREHIDRWTRIAVGIALVGIVAAGILYGRVPWISLILAITFALYGAVKKGLRLAPITSLALETFSVAPLAFAFLAVMHAQGAGSFGNAGLRVTALLALSGVVTAVPLLLFGVAATSISLQLIGFIQYLTPTSQLLLGLFLYKEKPNAAVVAAFVAVLVAVVIFAVTRFKKREAA